MGLIRRRPRAVLAGENSTFGTGIRILSGSYIRQDYQETAIRWISDGEIERYMSKHQHDKNAVALWNHFNSVIAWVKATIPKYRKQMKGVDWGPLYKAFGDSDLDPDALEAETRRLMIDDDVTNKTRIYPYLLDRNEGHLNLRTLTDAMNTEAFERQDGVCSCRKETFRIDQKEGDHVDPLTEGGKTNADNCQMLRKPCNRRSGAN